jgi:hypothetical protein
VRGLTELTREGEVPVWGVKWPVASVRPVEAIPNRHVHVTYMHLGTMFGTVLSTQGWDGPLQHLGTIWEL